MASLAEDRDGGLLPFGWFGTVGYCAVLTLLFLFLGFPFNSVGERLVGTLASATGAQISFADLSPYLSIAGPGFEASDVRIVGSDGTRFDFDRMRVRPAWSMAWLRLAPALHIDIDGPLGRVVGTAVVDAATPAFDGELEGVDLARLPVAALWPDLTLSGSLDADIELAQTEGAPAPEGKVVFEARDGDIGASGLPMGLPYETLTGELELGGESLVRIVTLKAVGPLLNADATGEIGMDEYFVRAPLDVEIQIQAEPSMAPAMRSMGLPVDANGAATVHIAGSPSAPEMR